ncbi:hypothetical protein Mapa_002685 [Marchantia paleacea]|nr:hypothetical protein Mapa_002685 [Marchantia paleacea]
MAYEYIRRGVVDVDVPVLGIGRAGGLEESAHSRVVRHLQALEVWDRQVLKENMVAQKVCYPFPLHSRVRAPEIRHGFVGRGQDGHSLSAVDVVCHFRVGQ